MTTTKQRRTLGERAFEVELCYEWPEDGFGDRCLDDQKYKRRFFATKPEADAFAREVFPLAIGGQVCITEVEWVDPYGDGIPGTYHWEYVGESDWYTGEDE